MSSPSPPRKPLIPPKALLILGVAFAVGLLLFLMVWLDQRNDTDFFKGGPAASGSGDTTALPAPLPPDVDSGSDNASGLQLPTGEGPDSPRNTTGVEQPRIINEPVAPAMPLPSPTAPTAPTASADRLTPLPISRPAPRYPQQAQRSGIQGAVQVRATVAPDGSVERMELARSSGNRHLDRAAMEAVRRWRFDPATRGGQPISADVVIPIEFNMAR